MGQLHHGYHIVMSNRRMSRSNLGTSAARGIDRAFGAIMPTRVGQVFARRATAQVMDQSVEVRHHGVALTLATPNWINYYRADTFSSKEPETLEWIDSIPEGSTLWDVGANVGLYACYAAAARRCAVVAFEPSVFNLELLARNVFRNGLTDRITIVPNPLTSTVGTSSMSMTTTEWGGAESTFGAGYGSDGSPLESVFTFCTAGMTLDAFCTWYGVSPPDYLKIDVDGIEHLILKGANASLPQIQSVLIEVHRQFGEQHDEVARLLTEAGFLLAEERQSDMMAGSVSYRDVFNQIWSRG